MLSLLLLLSAAPLGEPGEVDEPVRGLAAADRYRFTLDEAPSGTPVEAIFQKGAPVYFRADKIEFFRRGEVLVYRQDDRWQRTRTGTTSDPLRILGASARVRAARLPHEELLVLLKALAKVAKAREKDRVVFRGELSAAGARQLARSEDRDLARGGTARLWLDANGRLAGYEIAIVVRGRRGNADVDGVMTRTVTLADVGTARIEVPAAARKALE